MGFKANVTDKTVFGDKNVHLGTFESDGGSTGGEVDTGLQVVEQVYFQLQGSAVSANAPAYELVNEGKGGKVTLVTDADKKGTFMAVGR